jgi:hypothetical protein
MIRFGRRKQQSQDQQPPVSRDPDTDDETLDDLLRALGKAARKQRTPTPTNNTTTNRGLTETGGGVS